MNPVTGDLSRGLLTELECPVCMEYMLPPIELCENGHNICPNCKPKLQQCPTCRRPFANIRNVALEKMARQIEYPCSYWRYGCTKMVNLDVKNKHERICPYNQYNCPLTKVMYALRPILTVVGTLCAYHVIPINPQKLASCGRRSV
jgi:E3 ubiquitin-protein ligase SIAH1